MPGALRRIAWKVRFYFRDRMRAIPKPVAPYVPFMALATLTYLAVELGFNARLLDITGLGASKPEVDSIERWGRCISGVAVTLAFWGIWLLPRACRPYRKWPVVGTMTGMVLSAAVLIPAVYTAERMIVDGLVNRSTGERRRAAAHLEALSGALLQGRAEIAGMELPREALRSPEGKAFLSVFPMAALSTPDLAARTEALVPAAVRNQVEQQDGGVKGIWNNVFRPAALRANEAYDTYRKGSERYENALANIPAEQTRAWNDYAMKVRNRSGRTPEALPRQGWAEARSSVVREGLVLPSDWNPGDRQSFNVAVAFKVRRDADAAFRSATADAADGPMRPGLGYREFMASPQVQGRFKAGISVPDRVTLMPDMSSDEFVRTVYRPTVEREIAK